jgi:hypothetical protein
MKRYNFFVVFIIFFLFSLQANAQTTDSVNTNPSAKDAYLEIGGAGFFSINYDQRFKGQKGLGFHLGLGGIGLLGSGVFSVPVGLNYLSGSKGNYIEIGAGASILTVSERDFWLSNNTTTTTSTEIIGFINLGYRYQPEKKGFTGRVFISPIFYQGGFLPFYGGISAGIKF